LTVINYDIHNMHVIKNIQNNELVEQTKRTVDFFYLEKSTATMTIGCQMSNI